MFNRDAFFLIERKDFIIKNICSRLLFFAGIRLAKCKTAIGINDSLQVDSSNPLQTANKKSVMAKQISRVMAFYV